MTKQITQLLVVFIVLTVFLASCAIEKRSETIIIPSNLGDENQENSSFQVKRIFHLPKPVDLLGWSDINSVIGIFNKEGILENMENQLQRLTYPYEDPVLLQKTENDTVSLNMSPDGKNIVQMKMSSNGDLLKLISVTNGKETEIDQFSSSHEFFLQDVTWSSNSRYLSYLSVSVLEDEQSFVGVYDTVSGSLQTYELKDFDKSWSLTRVNISDDGKSLLFTMFQSINNQRIVMGTINSSNEVEIQYEHQIGHTENAWLNNYKFVFLDVDERLNEYDRRNGEISILLEKVSTFKLSNDREKIAYFLTDQENIYVGKLQAKNILYQEPVYQGLMPSEIYWSPDGKNILIYGSKLYSTIQSSLSQLDQTDKDAYIIELK